MLKFKPAFHSSLTLIRGSLVLLHFLPLEWYHLYIHLYIHLRLLIFLPAKDSSLWLTQPSISHDALCMKLNKQDDNIQPWCTPFPILNQSIVPCMLLTVASWSAYRFLKVTGKVVWYSHLFKNFPVCCDPHSQRLPHSQWNRSRCFCGIPLLSPWSNECWQFDLWFLCFF